MSEDMVFHQAVSFSFTLAGVPRDDPRLALADSRILIRSSFAIANISLLRTAGLTAFSSCCGLQDFRANGLTNGALLGFVLDLGVRYAGMKPFVSPAWKRNDKH